MTKDPHIKSWTFKTWREPILIVSTTLFVAAIILMISNPGWLTALLLLVMLGVWFVLLYFFRDPAREVLDQPGLVIGPCDGTVMSIERLDESRYMKVESIRVSIFLSLFDVHVQRIPLSGEVMLVDHQPGKYLQAFRPEASEVNEYIAMKIGTSYGVILVKQIAGIMARRCVNFASAGDTVKTGVRYGHIKFGSRVDLFVPPQAEVLVEVGDKVYGGLTPIAQLSVEDDGQRKT